MTSVSPSTDQTFLQSLHELQVPSFVLVPVFAVGLSWVVFLLLWLQFDRPDKLGNYQDKKDYSFPRWGVTQPAYMAREKSQYIFMFQLSFLVLSWLFSVDIDGSESGVGFYLFSTIAVFVIVGLIASSLYSFVTLRNEYLLSYNTLTLLTIFISYVFGSLNYFAYVSLSYAQTNGKYYVHVQPSNEALAYKDAGIMEFGPMAKVEETQTLGYKIDSTIFCIAPIINPLMANTLQFFAVGESCCEHQKTFKCGTYGPAREPDADLPVVAGYVISDRDAADLSDGFFQQLAKDLYRYMTHGSKLRSNFSIFKEGAVAIAQTMGRSVSTDAIFVEVYESPVTNHDSFYGIQSLNTKNWITNSLTDSSAEHAQWYVTKGVGSWYNIMTKINNQWRYLGRGEGGGALSLATSDSGLGTERWIIGDDSEPGQLKLLSPGKKYLNADLTLTVRPPGTPPKWKLRKQDVENTEPNYGSYLNGPFNFYGSLHGFVSWLVANGVYFLVLLVVMSFLRPAPKNQTALLSK